ncbi:hypothetical protein [Flavobacterium sp. 83]|uniref:hypothetical protein n=1 Tax=Flavobacterium sp. 83 TaxID=1131812 RepID=UPI000A698289|nr:hypothetical protein [Flavobacterium sp. 83]
MIHNLLKTILFVYILFSNISGYAQLGYTEKQIIKGQGEYFNKVINDSSIILFYNPNLNTDYGKPPQALANYHLDRKTGKCYYIVYNCPNFVADSYYKTLNTIAVKIDDHTWSSNDDNSIYQLNLNGIILKVEHCYLPLRSTVSSTKLNSTILSLQNELNKYKNENKILIETIESLKVQQKDLTYISKDMTILTAKGAENIEKALESIKDKDLKISRLQDALTKKDSIMLLYIKELKMKSDKK